MMRVATDRQAEGGKGVFF